MDHDGNNKTCLNLDLGLGLSDYAIKKDNLPKISNHQQVFLDFSISNHRPSEDHVEGEDTSSSLKIKFREDDDESNLSRKKLRLTNNQTTLLEDSFKQHCTLNMAQKQALAEQLNLKPRQVEVWFQNRRARTKLKQTEINCEFLKKNCERLSEENRLLKKELLELRSSVKTEKISPPSLPPFLYHITKGATTLKKCSSCDELDKVIRGGCSRKKDMAGTVAVMEVVHEPKPNNMQESVAELASY